MIQVENSLNLLESGMEPQDSVKPFKKLWAILPSVLILATSAFLVYYNLSLKPQAPQLCWNQASLKPEIQEADPLKINAWRWLKTSTLCMNETENQKLRILQKGLYLVFGEMKRKMKDKAPFATRLMKGEHVLNQKQSEDNIIKLLEIYQFNEGDEISLDLNDNNFDHMEKDSTETYWGILHMVSYNS
ncbi:tumor necrosis factor ligand superfamily member 18 [Macrotis lagotis]|uniref:tumor necrosis factor ligand superfamily member 18 n=1 Tax=Macrotis lagotis TaxID=92651 RepID=UPI003D69352C